MSKRNKLVVITGGGRGIGAACAEHFYQQGFDVMITSRSEQELIDVVRKCQSLPLQYGQRIEYFTADISQVQDIEKLFLYCEKKIGLCHVLINNAGVIAVEDFLNFKAEQYDLIMDVNMKAAFFCAQFAAKQMMKHQQASSIINISSLGGIAGLEKFKGFSAYSMSKFGVIGLTETLAVELREYGIRVNCVAPGAVDTQMLKQAAPFLKTQTTPMDIAKIVFTLADEDSSKSLTGITIPVYSNL